MRTTLTLDDDVAQLLADAQHRQRRSAKHIINDSLRRTLTPRSATQQVELLPAHNSSLRPGYDLAGFNHLADELENDEIVRIAEN